MKRLIFVLLAMALVCGMVFTSCSTAATTSAPVPSATSPKPPATSPAAVSTTTTAPTAATTTAPTAATTTKPSVAATSTQQYGGVLKIITNPGLTDIGLPGEINASNDGSYRQPALEELLRFDAQGKGQIVPCLATAWQYNSNYTTLTFTLRKGVKFHDGTDFNAAAAKFSLDLVLNSTYIDLQTVSSIEVVDDYTLRLNLKTYDASLLSSIAGYYCPIVSPTAIKSMSKAEAMLRPVGTGPFKFVSYTRDVSLIYAKFTDYWQTGKPYLDGIQFNFIADPVVALASLKAGEGQVLRAIAASDASALKATGKYALNTQEVAIDCLAGDSAHPDSVYSKLKVRQAIAYAIDNAAVAKAIGQGFFLPCNQLISPTNLAYNPDIVGYPYNPDKAKQLLSDAGYPKGFDTKLSFRAGAFEADYCAMIQGYLKAVGINLTLDNADMARFNDLRVKGFNNQMVFLTIPQGTEKDMSYWIRDRLSTKSSLFPSTTVYSPDDYNAKLFAVDTERDDAKRLQALKDVDKLAIDTYELVIPVQVETGISAASNQVMDSELYKYYAMSYRSENIWLSK